MHENFHFTGAASRHVQRLLAHGMGAENVERRNDDQVRRKGEDQVRPVLALEKLGNLRPHYGHLG
jgi:hypothetical protein